MAACRDTVMSLVIPTGHALSISLLLLHASPTGRHFPRISVFHSEELIRALNSLMSESTDRFAVIINSWQDNIFLQGSDI